MHFTSHRPHPRLTLFPRVNHTPRVDRRFWKGVAVPFVLTATLIAMVLTFGIVVGFFLWLGGWFFAIAATMPIWTKGGTR